MRTRPITKASTAKTTHRRTRLVSAATVLPLALGLASTQLPSGRPGGAHAGAAFALSCTLPFAQLRQSHPIDSSCGLEGKAAAGTPQALQNEAKNNFCASGTPQDVTFDILRKLQQEAARRVSFGGDSKLPTDRSPLRNIPSDVGPIGEGTVVRLAAFIVDPHYSNLGSGESVNCKQGDKESNDIHIVLGQNSNSDDPCSSVTAEISPHFRPDIWSPDILKAHNDRLFRFTGQLFFDASHVPCVNGMGPNPKRSTLWEIHPVYSLEICNDPGNQCTVDNDRNWISLVDFINGNSTETRLRLPRAAISATLGTSSPR